MWGEMQKRGACKRCPSQRGPNQTSGFRSFGRPRCPRCIWSRMLIQHQYQHAFLMSTNESVSTSTFFYQPPEYTVLSPIYWEESTDWNDDKESNNDVLLIIKSVCDVLTCPRGWVCRCTSSPCWGCPCSTQPRRWRTRPGLPPFIQQKKEGYQIRKWKYFSL